MLFLRKKGARTKEKVLDQSKQRKDAADQNLHRLPARH